MAIMRIVGLIDREKNGLAPADMTGFEGEYVVEYDPGRNGTDKYGRKMLVHLVTSPHKWEALDVPIEELADLWLAVDPRGRLNRDGSPSRPLRNFRVQFVEKVERWLEGPNGLNVQN